MLIELHILQNFAPSCLNRDDTNSPKSCEFGCHTRARISSQCIKRAIRRSEVFGEKIGESIATRSKRIHKKISDLLAGQGISGDWLDDSISALLAETYCAMEKAEAKKSRTSVALYLSYKEIQYLADVVRLNSEDFKKNPQNTAKSAGADVLKKIKECHSADIALFGRMMAEKPELNYDAASQVAHALSTNAVNMEMDFFTAVDDLMPEEESGADMMGIVEYNSSCFYRYSNIDINQLMKNLHDDSDLARKTVEAFLYASILAIPTGKQTSMAAQNPPSLILAVVKETRLPWSLANAFIKPIHPDYERDLMDNSIVALDRYWAALIKSYGSDGIKKIAVCEVGANGLQNLKEYAVDNIGSLISAVLASVEFKEQKV